ncbi:hypothetical protein ACHAWU_003731 [Discostella pseudostelligera]|uniref:AB hydrolase-1 domain-containing protein n=1 Tax=Discostella pseudostelligera TaxID=259834 RepID=A0ABD3N6A2_9STRA
MTSTMHFSSLYRTIPKSHHRLLVTGMRSSCNLSPVRMGITSVSSACSSSSVQRQHSIKSNYQTNPSSTNRKRRFINNCFSSNDVGVQSISPIFMMNPSFKTSSNDVLLPTSSVSFYSTMPCITLRHGRINDLVLCNRSTPLSLPNSTQYAASITPSAPIGITTTTRHKSSKKENIKDASMDDEYGAMNSAGKTYTYPSPYHLESFGTFGHWSGSAAATTQIPRGVLHPAYINYNTFGTLNETRDNVLVICHALTGNASLEAWWGDLLGPGKAFDTDQYFIVCCNILGSCYGSVGPSSVRPGFHERDDIPKGIPRNISGQVIYGMDFPDVSVRDTVRLQLFLLKHELKISSVKCVIGGSFGGMQVMEYCVMAGATRPVGVGGGVSQAIGNSQNGMKPLGVGDSKGVAYGIGEFVTKRNGRIEPFVRSAVPIACGAAHTAWQIGISETQRQAIYADPKWSNGRYDPEDPPIGGLSVARQIAMISYRTPLGYHKKFGRALTDEAGPNYGSKAPWQVKSYLEYQGKKFVERFDPVTYVKLTEQMDSHDIGRGRGSLDHVLSHVEIPVCVLGIDSDVLYPLREQEELVQSMPNAELKIIHSDAGHDGFLLEQDQVASHIKSFLYSHD